MLSDQLYWEKSGFLFLCPIAFSIDLVWSWWIRRKGYHIYIMWCLMLLFVCLTVVSEIFCSCSILEDDDESCYGLNLTLTRNSTWSIWCGCLKVAWTLLLTMLSDFVLMLVIPCWASCCLLVVCLWWLHDNDKHALLLLWICLAIHVLVMFG